MITPQPDVLGVDVSRVRRRVMDFVELGKPRVVVMVLITTAVGFYLGSRGGFDYLRLLPTLIGTALAASGTLALNQYCGARRRRQDAADADAPAAGRTLAADRRARSSGWSSRLPASATWHLP